MKEAAFFASKGQFHERTVHGSDLSKKDMFCEGSKKIPGGAELA